MELIAAQFVSKTAAGIVYVELGWIPDMALLISGHDQAVPDLYWWVRGGVGKTFPLAAAAVSIKIPGAGTAFVRDTTGIDEYAGGEVIAVAETDQSDPKHVTLQGTPSAAGHMTAPGLKIPIDHQVAGATINILIGFRITAQG
jgi:hypothetical protein